MVKLIIFDMDGLMLDTESLYCRAFCDTCVAFGLEPRREVYLKAIGADDEFECKLYGEAFPEIDATSFHAAVQVRCTELLSMGFYSTKPGLFELFEAIERKGDIQTAVVTSNQSNIAIPLLTGAGVMPHLNGAVYRDMVERGKPFPDSHLLCLQRFSVAPSDALVLEDSETGIRAALAAGIPVIAIPDLIEPSPDLISQCLARCNSLDDVIPYLGA